MESILHTGEGSILQQTFTFPHHSCDILNNRVFLSRNYGHIVALRKSDVLKTYPDG